MNIILNLSIQKRLGLAVDWGDNYEKRNMTALSNLIFSFLSRGDLVCKTSNIFLYVANH